MGKYLDIADAFLAKKAAEDAAKYSPPLNADGAPCGGCPSCGRGEFWRWPKSHQQHNATGWICWFLRAAAGGERPLRLLRGA